MRANLEMQAVVTEGQFFRKDDPLPYVAHTLDAAFHRLYLDVALAFAFKKLTAFQVDSIPSFHRGKWAPAVEA